MAVDDAVKMWSRSNANHESQDLLERRFSAKDGYTVTHDPDETQEEILKANNLPKIGDTFEGLSWVFCKRRAVTRGLVMSFIDVEYEGEVGPGDDPGSPLDDLPKYEFSSVASTEPMDECLEKYIGSQSIAGEQIATVNDEAIEGVTKEVYDVLLTVDRNFLDINLAATMQYLDSVNSDAFPPIKPFPPGTGRLRNFRAVPQLLPNGGIKYWQIHAEFLFRTPYRTTNERAWWARRLHEGYWVKYDNDAIANGADDLQMNNNKPFLLDIDGKKLQKGAQALWLDMKVYTNQLPYNALGLF